MRKAGIPKERRKFKTKEHLTLDVVHDARENKLHFGWVGADGGYGKGPGFCIELEKMGDRFIIDVPTDVRQRFHGGFSCQVGKSAWMNRSQLLNPFK